MNDQYKDIEKRIDPTKLNMELIPDVEDGDEGKVLCVNEELEPEWRLVDVSEILKDIDSLLVSINDINASLKDKADIEDFKGIVQELERLVTTVEVLAGRIELSVEESKILGAYLPGSNDIPTTKWRNIVNPVDVGILNGFLFEQNSGWIGSVDDSRLMFSGSQYIDIPNHFDTGNNTFSGCIDCYVKVYSYNRCSLIDGFYLCNDNGFISIETDRLVVNTISKLELNKFTHVCFNISLPRDLVEIYVDGEKVETEIVKKSSLILPGRLKALRGLNGELSNFKVYRKILSKENIKSNSDAGAYSQNFCYAYLDGLYEANKAECIYSDMESVKSAITVLKDEIALTSSRLTTSSGLTTVAFKKVRYIRDYQDGNSIDDEHRWMEIQCIDSGANNLAKGISATTNGKNHYNLDAITDSVIEEYGTVYDKGEIYVQIDLGKVVSDVMYLKIYRYYLDSRICHNTKTAVSEDGEEWSTLFDSTITGEHEEDKDGLIVPVNMGAYMDNMQYRLQAAELKITPEAIVGTVIDNDNFKSKYSTSTQTAEMIKSQVTVVDNKVRMINEELDKYKEQVSEELTDIDNAHTDLENTMNGAFKDGIISEAEAKAINERLIAIEKEKSDVDKEHEATINNKSLPEASRESLVLAMSSFTDSYANLKSAIITGISDTLITEEEIRLINTMTTIYKDSSSMYRKIFTEAVDAIGSTKINELDAKTDTRVSAIEQKNDSISLSVKSLTGNEIVKNGTFIDGTKEWNHDGNVILSMFTNKENKYANIFTNNTSAVGGISQDVLVGDKDDNYIVEFLSYSSDTDKTKAKVNIKFKESDSERVLIDEIVDCSLATSDIPKVFKKKIPLIKKKKYTLSIGKTETMGIIDVYLTDISVRQGSKVAKSSEISILDDKIKTKVDVDGVKSTIEQSCDSVKIGFNGINDTFEVTESSVNMRDTNGEKHMSLSDGRVDVYNKFGAKIGFIGRIQHKDMTTTSRYGLAFCMDQQDYIGFSFRSGGSTYLMDLFCNKGGVPDREVGVNLGNHLVMNGWNIKGDIAHEPNKTIYTDNINSRTNPSGGGNSEIDVWNNINMNNYSLRNTVVVSKSIVQETLNIKSRCIENHKSVRVKEETLSIFETCKINSKEYKKIYLPQGHPVIKYSVFLQAIGINNVYLVDKQDEYFTVYSDNNCTFDYRLDMELFDTSVFYLDIKKQEVEMDTPIETEYKGADIYVTHNNYISKK